MPKGDLPDIQFTPTSTPLVPFRYSFNCITSAKRCSTNIDQWLETSFFDTVEADLRGYGHGKGEGRRTPQTGSSQGNSPSTPQSGLQNRSLANSGGRLADSASEAESSATT